MAFKAKVKTLGSERMKIIELLNLLIRENDTEIIDILINGTILKIMIVRIFQILSIYYIIKVFYYHKFRTLSLIILGIVLGSQLLKIF